MSDNPDLYLSPCTQWMGCQSTPLSVACNFDNRYTKGDINVTQPQADQICRSKGGHLAAINTKGELELLQRHLYQMWDETYTFSEQPLIGMKRQGKTWIWEDGSKGKGVAWAKGEPNNLRGIENCVKLNIVDVYDNNDKLVLFKGDIGTINDTPCDRVSTRYICSEKLPVNCDVNTRNTTTGCVCNPGFIDIRETTLPDGKLYTKTGMKCIALNPCGAVVESQTIIFIMDSSGSVGQTGWDNQSRVGFIKYATNVTEKLWLKDSWTEQDFLDAIPKQFDDGGTATAAAIEEAADLLKLKLTEAKLLAVGFGDGLGDSGRRKIESWLDNPLDDYFAYQEETALFTDDHIKSILTKVCDKK